MRFFACAMCASPVLLGAVGAVGALAGACSASSGANVTLAPTLLFPQGVIETISTLTVTVYDGSSAACDATTGQPTGVTPQTPVVAAATALGSAGCAAGVKFCGTLKMNQSATPRVFAAVGKDSNQLTVASGCAKEVVNQDQVGFTITMLRNTPPSVCGNNMVDPTEQCDPPGSASDPVCDAMCHTKEEYLSTPSMVAGSTQAGKPGDKTLPQFVWPSGTGALGWLTGIWQDHATPPDPVTQQVYYHLSMRLMGNAMAPLATSDFNAEAAQSSFFIPNDSGDAGAFPPTAPDTFDQGAPSVALVGGTYYVAYQDDHQLLVPPDAGSPPNNDIWDIHMRTMSASTFTANQPIDGPIGINGPGGFGETGVQIAPSIAAGPNGDLLIVWESVPAVGQPGQIFGIVYHTSSMSLATGGQTAISNGPSDSQPVVIGTPTGWVVAWTSGTDIRVRPVGADGSATTADMVVNDAQRMGREEHPSIATLADGSYAIVWADHGAPGGTDIVLQRFNADGTLVAGDQALPLNTTTMGEQVAPAVTASGASGGFFASAWVDQPSGHIRARLFSMTQGYLFNNVDGSDQDFQASLTDGHTRNNPALAVGGAGQYLAIGWEDLSPAQPGVYARRFPVPQP